MRALRAAPTASADIEERIRAYVREMARPIITGIGDGEQLRSFGRTLVGTAERSARARANFFPMMALLHGDAMVGALARGRADGERSTAASGAQEAHRRAESEFAELAHVEEAPVAPALANGEDEQRSPDAPPAAVLGVRIAEAKRSRAA